MAERKDRMALLSRYSKLYTQKYEQRPQINLNVEQWAADALIESYGISECYDLLAYYFEIAQNPNWKYFANYAQDIIDKKQLLKEDIEERKARREMAKRWLSE